MTPIKVKKLDRNAKYEVAYRSNGLDVFNNDVDITIEANSSAVISTGLAFQPPDNVAIQVWAKSGLSTKQNLEKGAGFIDNDYRGEVKIHLYNHSNVPKLIKKGVKVAQLVFVPVVPVFNNLVEVNSLEETERGEKGFGSSGT